MTSYVISAELAAGKIHMEDPVLISENAWRSGGAGTEGTFAELMNQYAAKLGMTNTHFMNASGLPDPNHYTTAHDIALLSRALIHDYPEEYKVYAIKEFEWNGIKQHNR